jgi:transglutaminase-like putative cysteine protease
MTMRYDIRLTMEFAYEGQSGGGRHAIRVLPRSIEGVQRLVAGHVDVAAKPAERNERTDFFGTGVVDFAYEAVEGDLFYRAQARVERMTQSIEPELSTLLAALPKELASARRLDARAPSHFLAASPMIAPDAAVTRYALDVTGDSATVYEAALALNAALNRDMRYDADATDVGTPLSDAFEARHGVCQDFSHIMIAGLRQLGIPAAYVSGYLRTIPPEGTPRLEGADAMHAWVAVWCGAKTGWVEFDPTNDLVIATDHIVVGYGRDYSDVAPVRGVIRTAGSQTTKQAVDVIPVVDDHDRP